MRSSVKRAIALLVLAVGLFAAGSAVAGTAIEYPVGGDRLCVYAYHDEVDQQVCIPLP